MTRLTRNRRSLLFVALPAGVALVVGITVAVSTAAPSPGCDPVEAPIKEAMQFTPVDQRMTVPLDPPINILGVPAIEVPSDAQVPNGQIDGLPLRWATGSANGSVYQYFGSIPIADEVTVSKFFASGGIELDRDLSDDGGTFVEYLLKTLEDRAVPVEIGDHAGAMTWADPDANGLRPHHLYWSDGVFNYALIANRSAEDVLTLGRGLVCGGGIG